MFVEIPPHIAVSDFVRCVKRPSSTSEGMAIQFGALTPRPSFVRWLPLGLGADSVRLPRHSRTSRVPSPEAYQ
jgi:hypothetical protein